MAQLADYRTAVRALGYDGLPSDNVLLDGAIQQARRRIFQDRRWSFLEKDATALITAANDETVSLATITDLMYLESVRHTTTDGSPLEALSYQQLRDLRQNYPDDTGAPRYWARHNGELVFFPTPDAGYTLDIAYVKYPDDLAAATNDVIPDQLQDLVVWAAVVPLAFRQRDFQAASAAENAYVQKLTRAAAQDGKEQRQTSKQVRSGYWS